MTKHNSPVLTAPGAGVKAMSQPLRFLVVLLIPVLCAAGVALVYTLFHLYHLQQFMDWDQFAYIGNIENNLRGGYVVCNPHHLHFEFTGRLFHDFMRTNFGQYGFTDLIFNLRLRSLAAAGLGLFFLFLFLKETTGRITWALLGTLAVGFTHGYLSYADKIDTGIFPAAAFCLILWVFGRLCRARRGSLWLALALGVSLAIGVLMHQFIGFACVLAGLVLALPAFLFRERRWFSAAVIPDAPPLPAAIETRWNRRWLAFFIVCLTGVALIVAAYFYVGKTYYNLSDGEKGTPAASHGMWRHTTLQKWLFTYETADKVTYHWGTGLSNFYPFYPWRGFTDAFLSHKKVIHYSKDTKFAYNLADMTDPATLVENVFAVFTALTLLGLLVFLPALARRYGRTFVLLLLCLPVYLVFFTYWEPHYYEFWILPALILTVLCVLLLNLWGEKLAALLGRVGRFPFLAAFTVFLFLLAGHNILYYQVPFSRTMIWAGREVMHDRNPKRYALIEAAPYFKHPGNVYAEITKKK
jgi:hypothetical protein